jgi:TetR/AcrR family transcriptional repressor of nem operon
MITNPATYQRIIESAKELIYSKSYADVGVAAICEKANVKKGSFYHFFQSKQALTLAVIETYYTDFKDRLIDRAFDSQLPPLERINLFCTMSIEMQCEIHHQTGHVYGCPFGNLATELSTQDETIRAKLDCQFAKLQNLFRAALQEAVDRGDVKDINVDTTARAILALFEGSMLLAKTHNDPNILRQLLPSAAELRL